MSATYHCIIEQSASCYSFAQLLGITTQIAAQVAGLALGVNRTAYGGQSSAHCPSAVAVASIVDWTSAADLAKMLSSTT